MSKTYFLLIGGLVVLALAIGGYAFYKSGSKPGPTPAATTQPTTNYPSQPADQSSQPTVSPQKNQIALTITAPQNGAQVSILSTKVAGKTAANVDVSVNDQDLKTDATGNFTTTIALDEGDNYISITAIDDSGNVAEQEITVTYTPAQ